MKLKSLLTLSLLATSLTIAGCQQQGYYSYDEQRSTSVFIPQKNKYGIKTVVDEGYEPYCKDLPEFKQYLEGEIITFQLVFSERVEIFAYLNNELLEPKEVKDGFKNYEFRMPSQNSTIEIGGYLFGQPTSIRSVVYELDGLTKESIKGVQVKIGAFRAGDGSGERDTGSDLYSEDARDIEYNYSILDLKQLKKTLTMETDLGPDYTVTYKLKDGGSVSFNINCRRIAFTTYDNKTIYFKFLDDASYPKILYPSNI